MRDTGITCSDILKLESHLGTGHTLENYSVGSELQAPALRSATDLLSSLEQVT